MRSTESQAISQAVFAAVLILLGSVASSSANAQAIFRCEQKGKPVSLQSVPCAGKAKTTSVRGYVPEPAPTENELAWKRYRTEQEMAARNSGAGRSTSYSTTVVVPTDHDDCAAAKAGRDAWERQMGLKSSIDGMRAWQDRVYQACR